MQHENGKRMNSDAILIDCMDYMRTLPDKAFDLAVVDPPYSTVKAGGYMRNGKTRKREKKVYDTTLWKQPPPGEEYFRELFRVSKNQVIFGANGFTQYLPPSPCWVVWDKNIPDTLGWASLELAWTSFDMAAKMARFHWNGGSRCEMEQRIHPTQKPVGLYERIFEWFAKPGDRILDTHLGSGSSRIAAFKAGLDFVGCEIHPKYFEDSRKRFEEFRESWLWS